MSDTIKLELREISKQFPGVKALDGVSFQVRQGQVHAIIGENGAGKSTLMKILAGAQPPDGGDIHLNGAPTSFRSPADAIRQGIGIVYQELSNFQHLRVCENLFAGRRPLRGGLLDERALRTAARRILDENGLVEVDETTPMAALSLGLQQMIEISGLLSKQADLVILDEPTSALSETEVQQLFRMIAQMKARGVTILYVSHKLDEILALSDAITVLKDGRHVATFPNTPMLDKQDLIRKMVGREIGYVSQVGTNQIGEVLLAASNFSSGSMVRNVSFQLHAGEILGIAGLEGAGRTELIEALFGWRKHTGGTLYLRGQRVEIQNPRQAKKNRFAYLTKNRKQLGLFLPLPVTKNICAAATERYARHGLLSDRGVAANANHYIQALQIKVSGARQKVVNLSGGNQQKVLLSMWLTAEPDVILIDEPTRGVDVGAKSEIHALLRQIVSQGKAIVMVSSEIPEIMAICDRALVLCDGQLSGELANADMTEERMLTMASGLAERNI